MNVIPFLGAIFIKTLHATIRKQHIRVENIDRSGQHILVFWHAHIIPLLHSRWHRPTTVMLSASKDGELMARAFRWYGVDSVRGSSTRGGSKALLAIVRAARAGHNLAITPDGPLGPPHVAKDGAIYVAQVTGLPIIPVAIAATRKKLLRSWDRTLIPMPFSKLIYIYGDPIVVPRKGVVEEWRLKLEKTMNALADEADRMVTT